MKIRYGNIGVFGDKYLGQNSTLQLNSDWQRSSCFPCQFLYRTFPGKIIYHKNAITEYMCLATAVFDHLGNIRHNGVVL